MSDFQQQQPAPSQQWPSQPAPSFGAQSGMRRSGLVSSSRSSSIRLIAIGAVILIVGIAITIGTRHHPIGGEYFVAWGPMVLGAIAVIRGVVGLAMGRR